ncbi:5642_t:CDS:2, partial [Gigaspora margarita]
TNGLSVKIILKCHTCNTSIVHSNESPKVDFSKAIAGASLVEEFFEHLKISANESAQKALHNALTNQRSQNNFTLEVGFDFGWSYVRNAPQGSGEFIYNENLE